MTKQLLCVLFFAIVGVSTQAQEIKWMSFDQAIAAQKKKAKPIFIDVYTNWCPPCKMLDAHTFSDAKIAELINANYYAVKFNAEGDEKIAFSGKNYSNPRYDAARANSRNSLHQFAEFLKVRAFPTMIVLGADQKISQNIMGYRTAEQLLIELK
ncbi:thioredoxin family protein [Flavobacterium sp. JP2137]|uniref:thioredoxin family protein n=1 Tax=Flavobacterium sp. JP2137 TaxID=3414510 RepID=UPI003D2FF992